MEQLNKNRTKEIHLFRIFILFRCKSVSYTKKYLDFFSFLKYFFDVHNKYIIRKCTSIVIIILLFCAYNELAFVFYDI